MGGMDRLGIYDSDLGQCCCNMCDAQDFGEQEGSKEKNYGKCRNEWGEFLCSTKPSAYGDTSGVSASSGVRRYWKL